MEYGCIYMIMCMPTKKIYIGQTVDIKRRIATHYSRLRLNKHKNVYLQNSFNKYGINKIKWFILQDYIPHEKLNNIEKQWINNFNSYKNGFNDTVGGNNSTYYKKLTAQNVENMITDYLYNNYTQRQLAEKYKVHKGYITGIMNGKYWHDVTNKTINETKMICKTNKMNTFEKFKKRIVVKDEICFYSITNASKYFNVTSSAITYWIKIGKAKII